MYTFYNGQNIESGYLKPVADMLRNNPKLLCNVTADCLKIVMDGNAVFSGVCFNELQMSKRNYIF